jgi:glycosyltransferase involved in cell wall biosynthesis
VRILQVSANFPPSVGGIERYVEVLARGLVRRGHEVTVLSSRAPGAPPREQTSGVRIVRVPATEALKRTVRLHYPLPSPIALTRELRRLVPESDVVHVHDALYLTSTAGLAAARRRRIPSVVTQHVAFTPQSSRLLDAVEHGAIATVGRGSRLATRVVAYNAAVAEWAEARWGLKHVAVLPPGVPEPEAGGATRDELRREFGLDPDRFVALFVGRDVPTKRLDLLLLAADPAFEILAVTDRRPGTPQTGVRLLPFMPHRELQRLLLAVDAFVLPSKAEGLPLSLQEALLAGLPSLVTRVPGFDRYLRDDEVVWIEPHSESIRQSLAALASDASATAELAGRAKEAGRREFGLEAFLDAHEALYAELRRP